MRPKRARANKKSLRVFRSLGFREPFQIVTDAAFLTNGYKLDSLPHLISRTLNSSMEPKLMTTRCAQSMLRFSALDNNPDTKPEKATKIDKSELNEEQINELKGLDPLKSSLSLVYSKKLEIRRCPHHPSLDSSNCLHSIISSNNNAHHYIIATQDPSLRSKLRQIPNVPILFFNRGVLIFEKPSDATLNLMGNSELKKVNNFKDIKEKLQQNVENQDEEEHSENDIETNDVKIEIDNIPKQKTKPKPKPKPKDRKSAKNPLSCKKPLVSADIKKKKKKDEKKRKLLNLLNDDTI